jgi:glycerate 2-kinase
MRILIACDSFKDALPAGDVCRAVAKGFLSTHTGAQITEMPMAVKVCWKSCVRPCC